MSESSVAPVMVSFCCQRCCQPLRTHSSLNTIDEQLINELNGDINSNANRNVDPKVLTTKDKQPNVMYKVVTSTVSTDQSGNGFIVIGDSNNGSQSTANVIRSDGKHYPSNSGSVDRMKYERQLFDILSDQSDIDHPLCEECADFVIDQMDQQLRQLEDECKDYNDYLNKMEANDGIDYKVSEDDINEMTQKLANLETIEKQLLQELDEVNDQQKQVDEELEKQTHELQRLYAEEDKYWHEYNNIRNNIFICEDEQQSADNQLRYAQNLLDKLKRTNVFNATFHIWHSGCFGTINGFRLGRMPSVPVEWGEINAAWGQSALLLHSLANKMNFTFKRYKIVPYGNHSFLESLEDRSRELPLYASGGIRYFWNNKFDNAMVAFLDCLQQFKEHIQLKDSGMEKDTIEDTNLNVKYSIKIQLNSEEQWTKALKFMLTNLKWALAWVSSQST
ncbi:beclin-1-like isoform X2 [Oppia nitens]|uniref:beclin-1-like isoform X2 n=1 Tax=Oppia nitens TaxID=1686743 RepID=UPI0023DC879D|nr:beclin-1-like isoform X2 [Oppia nitens]